MLQEEAPPAVHISKGGGRLAQEPGTQHEAQPCPPAGEGTVWATWAGGHPHRQMDTWTQPVTLSAPRQAWTQREPALSRARGVGAPGKQN